VENCPTIGDRLGKLRGKRGAGRCQADPGPHRERKMATNEDVGGGGGGRQDEGDEARVKPITSRWLRTAKQTNRAEFEREMARRRQRFDSELDRFWRAQHSTT